MEILFVMKNLFAVVQVFLFINFFRATEALIVTLLN